MGDQVVQVIGGRRLCSVISQTVTSLFYSVDQDDDICYKCFKPSVPEAAQEAEFLANTALRSCSCVICATTIVNSGPLPGFFMRHLSGPDLLSRILMGALAEADARDVFYRVALAIEGIHARGWAHRGVQPENIFLDQPRPNAPYQSYLGELSLAAEVPPGGFWDPVGAPLFCAPEIHRNGRYGQPVDIWAFGVSLFVALTQDRPFPDPNKNVDEFLIFAAEEEFEANALWDRGVGQSAVDLIANCLRADPEERLTAAQVRAHPFFAGLNQ
jgi:serine/threonine protein kinase